MTTYTELFRFEYCGEIRDILEHVVNIDGVKEASSNKRSYHEVNGQISLDIKYDSYETDRTQVAQQIEKIEDANEVVFA